MSTSTALTEGSVVEKDASTSSLQVHLHPLVIMSVSDHFTRVRVGVGPATQRIVGALLGEQKGRTVDISGSFELVVNTPNQPTIDVQFFTAKLESFNKVFPKAEFLGWYTVGTSIDVVNDIRMHKQMMEYNENPLFLLLDATAVMAASQRELPLAIFESELRIINDAPRVLFSKLNYTIETNEAERIAVDHVAHLSTTSTTNDGAASTAHLASLQSAVLMLRTRLALLERYLQRQTAAAAAGDSSAALDIAGLRRVNALTQALPALATDAFDGELAASFNDGALLAYLVSLTRMLDQTNSVIDRVNAQSESKQRPQHVSMLGLLY